MARKFDKGLSWLVVFAAFIQQFIMMGTNNVFGVFYVELLDEFKESKAITGLVGSLAFGLAFLLGPISIMICHQIGHRAGLLMGNIFFSLGLLLSSFVDGLSQMFLTYSIMVGFGGSLCYFTSILILSEYFKKRLVTVNGLTLAGAGVGTLALSAGVERLLESYGWRTSMQIVCGFSLVQFVSLGIHCAVSAPMKTDGVRGKKVSLRSLIDTSMFKNKAYLVWVIVISLVLFGYYIPYVHLVRHCEDLGIPKSKGAILVGYLATSATIGKIIAGRIADNQRVNRIVLLQFFLLLSCVLTTLLPIMTSMEMVTFYSWAFGFNEGGFVVLIAIITGDIVGKDKMASALGMLYSIACIPITIGPAIAGVMYGISNSYNPAFFMSAALTAFSVCISFLIPVLLPHSTAEEVEMPSSGRSTSEGTQTSLVDKTEDEKLIEKGNTNDLEVVFMERSGATRTLRRIHKNEGTNNRLSLDFKRYFLMDHLVSQRDSLTSNLYSKENLYVEVQVPEVRETDV